MNCRCYDRSVIHCRACPCLEIYSLPYAHIHITRSPVPAILISGLTHHGVFFRKAKRISLNQAISHLIKRIEFNLDIIIFFFQDVCHIACPCSEHIIGIEQMFAVEPHVSVSVKTFKHQLNHIFLHDIVFGIEVHGIDPLTLRNPMQLRFDIALIRMSYQSVFIHISDDDRRDIHFHINV